MKAIRYLRYSSDGQSQHSIERQEKVTAQWLDYNNIQLTDTFTDEGYSARTFDRPDIKSLFDFIKKNHRNIDYMVVAELTRFSREAGDAINMVKNIQTTYGIRIVSAGRSTIYDCSDSNSFFMMGLEFLLGNSENIKRQTDINGGIYTAKATKGKWIQGGPAPYGFTKEGTGDARRLIQQQAQALIVRFIYDSYLQNVPLYIIREQAIQKGFTKKGSDAITEILKNPLYMGYQQVKPWKNLPGGLFELKNFTPIISQQKWYSAQEKMNAKDAPRLTVDDAIPLRGLLKCHCGKCLTGAASRGRHGGYYYYYKCQISAHNNVSAKFAHNQLYEMLSYMSVPDRMLNAISNQSSELLQQRFIEQNTMASFTEKELKQVQQQIESVEEKWINNQLSFESYNRWFSTYNSKRMELSAQLEGLTKDLNQAQLLLSHNLAPLSDLRYLYEKASTTGKQELLRRVFDSRLYYQNKIYRTPFIMPVFSHNLLILKQKQLLEVDGVMGRNRGGGAGQSTIEPLLQFLSFIHSLKVA